MNADREEKWLRATALKRVRAAVRLETSVAGDFILADLVPDIRARMDEVKSRGGLPALRALGIEGWAVGLRQHIQPILESAVKDYIGELGEGDAEASH